MELSLGDLRVFKFVYVGTPYTKYPSKDGINGRDRSFQDSARILSVLIDAGIKAYSPIVSGHAAVLYGHLNAEDISVWYPFNDAFLALSDCLLIAELDTWKDSIGIQHEIEMFEHHQKPIRYLNPNTYLVYDHPTI